MDYLSLGIGISFGLTIGIIVMIFVIMNIRNVYDNDAEDFGMDTEKWNASGKTKEKDISQMRKA